MEKQERDGVKESPEVGLRLSRITERPHFSVLRVRLGPPGMPLSDAVDWKPHVPPQAGSPRRLRRGDMAVGPFATRLIQREKAGARRVAVGSLAHALKGAHRLARTTKGG